MSALLGNRSVVNRQNRIGTADQPIRLAQEFCLYRRRIPHPGCNEVMPLIIVAERKRTKMVGSVVSGFENIRGGHAFLTKSRLKR